MEKTLLLASLDLSDLEAMDIALDVQGLIIRLWESIHEDCVPRGTELVAESLRGDSALDVSQTQYDFWYHAENMNTNKVL